MFLLAMFGIKWMQLPLAEEHCSKCGRTAKFNSMVVLLKEKILMAENYRARFDCVN